MNLRKIIKEAIYDSENINAIVKQLISAIDENGMEIQQEGFDIKQKNINVVVSAKNKTFPYEAFLEIQYEITKEGYNNPGKFGSSIDDSQAPEGECPEWEMMLINGVLYNGDGEPVYKGKEYLEMLFKRCYNNIHSQFDEKICSQEDNYPSNKIDSDQAYEDWKEKQVNLYEFIKKEVVKFHKKTLLESEKTKIESQIKLLSENEQSLKTASGNPLNGKSKQSAINYIYKIYKQIDHGQLYKDEAWENVHKIFNLFPKYGMDTVGGYEAEYNPGGINVDEMTPKWKRWYYDFNFIDNKGKERTITFVLKAHAAGTYDDPWRSYDITFYPIN